MVYRTPHAALVISSQLSVSAISHSRVTTSHPPWDTLLEAHDSTYVDAECHTTRLLTKSNLARYRRCLFLRLSDLYKAKPIRSSRPHLAKAPQIRYAETSHDELMEKQP